MTIAKQIFSLFIALCLLRVGSGQQISTTPAPVAWNAQWIFHPSADPHAFGVFHFRKSFVLDAVPSTFIVHVSGDNRYQLFVNGKRMAVGPAKGDIAHWRYETIDIAPALKKGTNTIASLIWNEGKYLSWSQVTAQSGFLLQGVAGAASIVNTGAGWKVMEDLAYLPPAKKGIVSPFEKWQAVNYPWGWEKNEYDDSHWLAAKVMDDGKRTLVANTLPPPEEIKKRFKTIRRYAGLPAKVNDNFITGTGALRIAPNDSVTILIDNGEETTAFPELVISGGKGASISIMYAEALYDSVSGKKGNRNDIDGKILKGNADTIWADGGNRRLYRPLFYRTFRYIQLTIKTAANSLELNDCSAVFTGYPFKENAAFTCSDPSIQQIWKTGWHTARLCAYETYMDCPYYEQLQYVGDTRIQALVSYSVSGDDRLVRNAIEQYSNSLTPDGLTHSRYPESLEQIIPPFSLFWIAMIHDYWRYRPDTVFVEQYFTNIKKVLDWHAKYIDSNSMLAHLPYWNFVDWAKEWPWTGEENSSGVPAGTVNGHSSILTLQYVYGLQKAAELFSAFHHDKDAAYYNSIAEKLKAAVVKLCWDDKRKLLADIPEKNVFSQHANVMGVLTNVFDTDIQKELIKRVASDSTIIQCTYYYRFYLNQAMKKAGWGNEYISMLQPWRDMIGLGLSTFAEKPEPTRSDCHAWSASPNYDLLATVAGIEPSAAGFKKVKIAPRPGALTWIKGTMPVPLGAIQFALRRSGKRGIEGEITLPKRLTGSFEWNDKVMALKPGKQHVSL